MRFEWDETKNLVNIQKHGIDFLDVPVVFENDMLIEVDKRFDYGEDRWIGIGLLSPGVVVVVWAEPQSDVIRIISTRRANRHERKKFEQYLSY
ncbi:BrnT family toxin [Acaryochloris sp. IP29b_bin.137]|uniref:BrnT family toxin n=1 Tax=Acaryochloris sp. IP29b_bin.137 TaxID=2969217 RepID=UPI0026285CCF|nr:BrnT family toxin [Acaryochloris sp. IP29b_bin.137]